LKNYIKGTSMILKKIILFLLFIVICSCRHGADIQRADDNKFEVDDADISGLNDPLETSVVVKVGNINGFSFNFWGTGGASLYRGYIDKTSLAATYQLYIIARSFSYMNWDKVRYMSQEGLKENAVAHISSEIINCKSGACIHKEDLILSINRQTLENLSTSDTTLRLLSSTVSERLDFEVNTDNTKKFISAMDKVISYLKTKKIDSTALTK